MSVSSSNDLLFLSLISAGLATPYDLKTQAGLSVGSTVPVLARLEKAGLITAGKAGLRGSRRFSVSKAGEKAVKSGWRELLERRPGAMDEVLRVVYLAWSAGERAAAANYAERAATDLGARAATKKAEAAQVGAPSAGERPGELFRWLKLRAEAAELEAAVELLRKLKEELLKRKKSRRKS